jgi:hypothetical protein
VGKTQPPRDVQDVKRIWLLRQRNKKARRSDRMSGGRARRVTDLKLDAVQHPKGSVWLAVMGGSAEWLVKAASVLSVVSAYSGDIPVPGRGNVSDGRCGRRNPYRFCSAKDIHGSLKVHRERLLIACCILTITLWRESAADLVDRPSGMT